VSHGRGEGTLSVVRGWGHLRRLRFGFGWGASCRPRLAGDMGLSGSDGTPTLHCPERRAGDRRDCDLGDDVVFLKHEMERSQVGDFQRNFSRPTGVDGGCREVNHHSCPCSCALAVNETDQVSPNVRSADLLLGLPKKEPTWLDDDLIASTKDDGRGVGRRRLEIEFGHVAPDHSADFQFRKATGLGTVLKEPLQVPDLSFLNLIQVQVDRTGIDVSHRGVDNQSPALNGPTEITVGKEHAIPPPSDAHG
jgi:hypothetical protein